MLREEEEEEKGEDEVLKRHITEKSDGVIYGRGLKVDEIERILRMG